MSASTTALAHVAALLGYAVFAFVLAFWAARTWLTTGLVLASLVTAGWAGVSIFVEWSVLPQWAAK